MWWQPHNFEKKRENLLKRAEIIKSVRAFFVENNFTEVQTPALQIMPTPDTHIQAFETEGYGLHTSPEIAMKKLLVAGAGDIYQICPVYRKNESTRLHSPEFTMLEWYRIGADYTAMMDDCDALLSLLGFKTPCERITVAQAFEKYTNLSSSGSLTARSLAECAAHNNIRTTETDTFEDIFHSIMAEKIEPNLGQGAPTILYDYPICMAALARKKPDDQHYAERFELYISGVEIANAFSELTNAAEQKSRLQADLKLKKELYGQDIPIDEDFIRALEYGMPESSGCALGLDRLIMLACGANSIDEVLWTGKP